MKKKNKSSENLNPFDVQIESNRLLLRNLKMEDTYGMFEYTSNPIVTTYLDWDPHTDIKTTEGFIRNTIETNKTGNNYAWAIVLKEIDKIVGVIRIFNVSFSDHRGELSYILNPNYQNKGYMVESVKAVIEYCFEKIGFNRMQARCSFDNKGSERVMQKSGLLYEGRLIGYFNVQGQYKDALIYGITRNPYLQNRIS